MSDTMDQTVEWLRGLAAKGGKGTVDNIDARSLGRIAGELEQLRAQVARDDEHYAAAMAMAEKHRKNWVEASQALNRFRGENTLLRTQLASTGEQAASVHPVQPHAYVPSPMHMGDCAVCGHLQGDPLHSPFRQK